MNPKKIRKEWHTRAHPEHDRLLFAAVHIQCADRIRTDCIISMIISKCVYSHVLFPFLQCCELILFFGWFVLLCFRYVFSLWLSEYFYLCHFLFSFLFLCLLHDVTLFCSLSYFIPPPCTAGSYPHAQQFYYAVDRGVGSTLTYDAPANLPDYSGTDISIYLLNICLFKAPVIMWFDYFLPLFVDLFSFLSPVLFLFLFILTTPLSHCYLFSSSWLSVPSDELEVESLFFASQSHSKLSKNSGTEGTYVKNKYSTVHLVPF